MKKAVIIVFILIIISSILGFIFVQNLSKESNKTEEINLNPSSKITPKTTSTITLTKNGFEPKELTITPNTRVVWINKSGRLATVDSNPHPIHTDHSELNLGEFNDGDSLTLVLTKTGEFKFHNHYNPDEGGTILVK